MTINNDILIWSLKELAEREEQERLWLGRSDVEMSSFEEAVCGVFDDSGVSRSIDSGRLAQDYGVEIEKAFNDLSVALGKVPSGLPPHLVIELEEMKRVRELARQILESNLFQHRGPG